jgi:hypothetical protein
VLQTLHQPINRLLEGFCGVAVDLHNHFKNSFTFNFYPVSTMLAVTRFAEIEDQQIALFSSSALHITNQLSMRSLPFRLTMPYLQLNYVLPLSKVHYQIHTPQVSQLAFNMAETMTIDQRAEVCEK